MEPVKKLKTKVIKQVHTVARRRPVFDKRVKKNAIKKPVKTHILNAGFIAVKNNEETKDFLGWWADKSNQDDMDPNGSDLDQKWLNFVNVYYNAGILRHPGYQMGFWNFHESSREITAYEDHEILLKKGSLRLMNFGNENNLFQTLARALPARQRQPMLELKQQYDKQIRASEHYKHAAGLTAAME